MRSVCFKEKLNIGNEALMDVITSANNDIRLILNHLSMLAADVSSLEAAKKYIKLVSFAIITVINRLETIHRRLYPDIRWNYSGKS